MANTLPIYYAQETLRMVRQPQSELQSLLSDLGLPHALLDSERIAGEMDAQTYGRLFMALIRMPERDRHQDPDPILDLSTYRLMFGYMLQADCLEDAINRAGRYYLRFHAEQHSFSLEQSDDTVHWRFHLGTPDANTIQATSFTDFSMGTLSWLPGLNGRMISLYLWHRLASWLIGNFIDLAAVRLDYPLEGNADDYILPFSGTGLLQTRPVRDGVPPALPEVAIDSQ